MGLSNSGTSPKSHCTLGTPHTLPHTPLALKSRRGGRLSVRVRFGCWSPVGPSVPIPTPSPCAPIGPIAQLDSVSPIPVPLSGPRDLSHSWRPSLPLLAVPHLPVPCFPSWPQSPGPIPSAPSLPQHCLLPDQVFGCRLEALCQRENATVPRFVRLCVEAVEERGRYPRGHGPPAHRRATYRVSPRPCPQALTLMGFTGSTGTSL